MKIVTFIAGLILEVVGGGVAVLYLEHEGAAAHADDSIVFAPGVEAEL